MITVEEIINDIEQQIYRGNKDTLIYELEENHELVIEVLVSNYSDELEIGVTWRESDANGVYKEYENSVCDYNDLFELKTSIEYVLQCYRDRDKI